MDTQENKYFLTIKVNANDFRTFLLSVGSVCSSAVTIKIYQKGFLEAVAISEDNSSLMLLTRILILNEIDMEEDVKEIWVKDMNKLLKLLDMHDGEDFEFSIRNNYIYYESSYIKGGAKFMLSDHPMQMIFSKITPEFFKNFDITFKKNIQTQEIKNLLRVTALASSDVEKIYLYQDQESNEIFADINDHTKVNVDCIAISLGLPDEGHMQGQIIIRVPVLAKLKLVGDTIIMEGGIYKSTKANSNRVSPEILLLSYVNDNVMVKYVLNTQKK